MSFVSDLRSRLGRRREGRRAAKREQGLKRAAADARRHGREPGQNDAPKYWPGGQGGS
jgi:hypothetical protein